MIERFGPISGSQGCSQTLGLRASPVVKPDTLESLSASSTSCFSQIWNFIVPWFFSYCDDFQETDSLENKIAREIPFLTEAVRELRKNIDKLDRFIIEHPELNQIVSETLPMF